jgi:hypothetical protein
MSIEDIQKAESNASSLDVTSDNTQAKTAKKGNICLTLGSKKSGLKSFAKGLLSGSRELLSTSREMLSGSKDLDGSRVDSNRLFNNS